MPRKRRVLPPQDHPLHGRLLQVLEVADGHGRVWRVRLYLDLEGARRMLLRAINAPDGITHSAGGGLVIVARRLKDEDNHGDGNGGENRDDRDGTPA